MLTTLLALFVTIAFAAVIVRARADIAKPASAAADPPSAYWYRLAVKRLHLASRFERQRNALRHAIRIRARVDVRRGLLCIHRFEGRWNDPGSPYWGGLQMDMTFQRNYGGPLLAALGPADRWPAEAQLAVATVAYYSGRGFGPWPNTRKACGL
jgi:hypothetical protein